MTSDTQSYIPVLDIRGQFALSLHLHTGDVPEPKRSKPETEFIILLFTIFSSF